VVALKVDRCKVAASLVALHVMLILGAISTAMDLLVLYIKKCRCYFTVQPKDITEDISFMTNSSISFVVKVDLI
jgi:hypothetical protein